MVSITKIGFYEFDCIPAFIPTETDFLAKLSHGSDQ